MLCRERKRRERTCRLTSAVDGWVLAAKYPACAVTTLTTLSRRAEVAAQQNHSSWPAPHNHHIAYISTADDLFPFPDNHFDVVLSSTFASEVKSASWLAVLGECRRCIHSDGWIELQSMDPIPSRQGVLMQAWVEARLVPGLEDCGLAVKPSKRTHYLETAGFANIKTCKIALPAVGRGPGSGSGAATGASGPGLEQDATRVMVQAGRHYYQELFHDYLKPLSGGANAGRLPWWWYNRAIRQECEREGTLFGFMISFGRKVDGM